MTPQKQFNLQSKIRLRNPTSLESAMSYVAEEENLVHLVQHNKQLPQKNYQPFRQQFPPPHNRPHFSNNYVRSQNAYPVQQSSNRPNETQQSHFFQNGQPQFPNRPINLTRNPNPPKQRFLTNSQVFLRPKNAFRPTSQIPAEKPTPMSTTSRAPTIKTQTQTRLITYRSPQNFNPPDFYHSPSKPNQSFISEELYQIDDEQQTEQGACCFATSSESDYSNYENLANDIDQTDNQYQPNDELSYQTDYDYQQTNNDDTETNKESNFPSNNQVNLLFQRDVAYEVNTHSASQIIIISRYRTLCIDQ